MPASLPTVVHSRGERRSLRVVGRIPHPLQPQRVALVAQLPLGLVRCLRYYSG